MLILFETPCYRADADEVAENLGAFQMVNQVKIQQKQMLDTHSTQCGMCTRGITHSDK